MAYRLPLDPGLIGYWGFDEANETDVALDETAGAHHLTLTNPVSVVSGRIGNARQFNGTSTYAAPAVSTTFQLLGDMTLTAWVRFDAINSSGSLLRTIAACDGPSTGDGQPWSLSVDSSGKLTYQHMAGLIPIRVQTAASTIKTARYYFVQMVRTTSGENQTIDLRIDNASMPVTVTVNGFASSFPVSPPSVNPVATLSVGRSRHASDSAFWQGAIDDLSIHNQVRPAQPYLLAAFFGTAVADVSARVTTMNNLRQIAGTDMRGGIRWWTYERDKSLYVVRESPFGYFEPEVQLTTNAALVPAGTNAPNLIYDPLSDTLVVVFINSGKVYKITASSTDAPLTQNMPFTVDSGTIVKVRELEDAFRPGVGPMQDIPYASQKQFRSPGLPTITLGLTSAGFGVIIPSIGGESSWQVWDVRGGGDVLLGTATYWGYGQYFFPITSRAYGTSYYAKVIPSDGVWPTGNTNTVTDYLGSVSPGPTSSLLYWNRYGDNSDFFQTFAGGGVSRPEFGLSTITRGTVKFVAVDPDPNTEGVGVGLSDPILGWYNVNRGTVKFVAVDPGDNNSHGVGASPNGGLIISNSRYSIFL